MKINKYLFIIIVIAILCILYYCFSSKTIENLDVEKEEPELVDTRLTLQETINQITDTISKEVKDMIFSQTAEANKAVDENIKQKIESIDNAESEKEDTEDEITKKVDALINEIDQDIQGYNATKEFDVTRGITVEIHEQDKIRSIVNKYLNQ